jgi:hypothetical protein
MAGLLFFVNAQKHVTGGSVIRMLNYFLPIAASFIALLQLAKDWGAHQTTWRRGAALLLIVLFGAGSAINSYYLNRRTARQHASDQAEIKGLKTAVETANHAQEANTAHFLAALDKLSSEVRDLQTQVKTEKLQSKLAVVQAELQKTQKALGPGPKAELSFTFFPFPRTEPGQPIVLVTNKTLPLINGSIHVEFNIVNTTDVDAVDSEVDFQICNGCRYAKEPDGLQKLPGLTDAQRYLYMHDLLAKMAYKTLSVDVIPPPLVQNFLVGIEYRCHTCVIPQQLSSGMVHILQ